MAVTVKKIELWRREVSNRPGALAQTLEPLARNRANLKVVMGYRFPEDHSKAAIELFPVSGAKNSAAARQGGLSPSMIPTLLIEGDNRAALGHTFAQALAEAGINLGFLVAQVMGNRYSAVMGFDNDADADRAAALIKKASAVPRAASGSRRKSKSRKARPRKRR